MKYGSMTGQSKCSALWHSQDMFSNNVSELEIHFAKKRNKVTNRKSCESC